MANTSEETSMDTEQFPPFLIEETEKVVSMLRQIGGHIRRVYVRADVRLSPTMSDAGVSAVYVLLFVVGLVGNLATFMRVLRQIRADLKRRKSIGGGSGGFVRLLVYVGLLCINDLAYLTTVPPLVYSKLISEWSFGSHACRLYVFVESTAKTLTAFALTLIAYERFVGACHPLRRRVRVDRNRPLIVALIALLFASLTNLPVLYQAQTIDQLEPLVWLTRVPPVDVSNQSGWRLRFQYRQHCQLSLGADLSGIATLALLAGGGFLLPFLTSAFLYVRIVHRVLMRTYQRHEAASAALNRGENGGRRSTVVGGISARRVGFRSLLVSLFYLLCYCPYWTLNVAASFAAPELADYVSDRMTGGYAIWAVHALPLVNTTANWIFYGVMNRHLVRAAVSGEPAESNPTRTSAVKELNFTCSERAADKPRKQMVRYRTVDLEVEIV